MCLQLSETRRCDKSSLSLSHTHTYIHEYICTYVAQPRSWRTASREISGKNVLQANSVMQFTASMKAEEITRPRVCELEGQCPYVLHGGKWAGRGKKRKKGLMRVTGEVKGSNLKQVWKIWHVVLKASSTILRSLSTAARESTRKIFFHPELAV
jgi:hypothetical protein